MGEQLDETRKSSSGEILAHVEGQMKDMRKKFKCSRCGDLIQFDYGICLRCRYELEQAQKQAQRPRKR